MLEVFALFRLQVFVYSSKRSSKASAKCRDSGTVICSAIVRSRLMGTRERNSITPEAMTVNSSAMARYPAAQARPAAMTRKIAEMSRALPAALRKRTREKDPATAMPVPTLPFTMRMTVVTMIGSTTSEIRKLRLTPLSRDRDSAAIAPHSPAKSRQSR